MRHRTFRLKGLASISTWIALSALRIRGCTIALLREQSPFQCNMWARVDASARTA